MTKLRVESFTISLDGFGAGPAQDLDNPLGVGGTSLHEWALATQTFQQQLFGSKKGETGTDATPNSFVILMAKSSSVSSVMRL